MVETSKELTNKLSVRKIVLPVLLGFVVAGVMLYNNITEIRFEKVPQGNFEWIDANNDGEVQVDVLEEFRAVDPGTGNYEQITYSDLLSRINWHWYSWFWLFISLLMVAIRDIGYMYRIRFLTDNHLSWRQSFDVIMLWEFASALTPSIVGGSGVAIYILNREDISVGRSSAVVMITALLDELFYILMVPLIFIIVGVQQLFPVALEKEIFGITLNTILPGIIWTDRQLMLAKSDANHDDISVDDVVKKKIGMIPAGNMGKPDDIGTLATFLSSEEAGYINSQFISVDGGLLGILG